MLSGDHYGVGPPLFDSIEVLLGDFVEPALKLVLLPCLLLARLRDRLRDRLVALVEHLVHVLEVANEGSGGLAWRV